MIRGTIVGGDDLRLELERRRGDVHGALKRGIGRAVLTLLRYVKASKLSDQVLRVRTGRLRRSITERVEESGSRVSGIVGTNVEYARVHEYGFKGTVSVREHLRKTKAGSTTVRAHTRKVSLPERSFLRSSLRDLQPQIREEIERSLNRAVRGGGAA